MSENSPEDVKDITTIPVGKLFNAIYEGEEVPMTVESISGADRGVILVCLHRPGFPRMDVQVTPKEVTFIRFVETEDSSEQFDPWQVKDKIDSQFDHDFFHHLDMTKKIAKDMGYKLKIQLIPIESRY